MMCPWEIAAVAQNIYDNKSFFDAYSRLKRSVEGLDGAPEWPSIFALLPDLSGRRVLDLGCGFGWFCRWAREHGAQSVIGVDLSEKMLARAKANTRDDAITYERADLESYAPPTAAFDLIYSSLAFHYVEDLGALFHRAFKALVPGGRMVFSVEHPIFTAPTNPGWSEDAGGHITWPVDRYLDEGPRTTNWLAPGVIKQHRTIGTYVNLLLHTSFTISHLEEWAPSVEQVSMHPDWANERERPPFLIVVCDRR
jgi:SAM-dependent methyltransferase